MNDIPDCTASGSNTGANRQALEALLNELLQPSQFRDYGPNGLQVEGKPVIRRLVTGVTASLALIEAAIDADADALLVHHGLFWRGQEGRLTGWMRQRVGRLIGHDLNLFAYHLPLDAHPVLGNNAQLAARLNLKAGPSAGQSFGDQSLGWLGDAQFSSCEAIAEYVERQVERSVTLVRGDGRQIRRVALCTGGAQGYFEAAISAGADVFITGEISEPQAHYARETGVAFIACGHHASERYGVQAVGQHVADTLGIEHRFIDIPNPA